MALILRGNGVVEGLTDLPAGSVTAADLASGAITSSALPAGSVLQVVQSSYSTEVSTTSTTYIDSGLSASITPSSTSSKIVVLISICGAITSDNHLHLAIYRGATQIQEQLSAFFAQSAGVSGTSISLSSLDSPSTTSSVTYSVKLKSRDSSENVRTCYGSGVSSIILMEIAG